MNIRLFRVDLSPLVEVLDRQAVAFERIAAALESFRELPPEPPLLPKKITAQDIGTYGDEVESVQSVSERLRAAGLSEFEIHEFLVADIFGKEG